MTRISIVLHSIVFASLCRITLAGEPWLLLPHQTGRDAVVVRGRGCASHASSARPRRQLRPIRTRTGFLVV